MVLGDPGRRSGLKSVGGTWVYPGNNSVPFRFGPENPQVASSTDERWYYSVYDALEQTPQGPTATEAGTGLCTDMTKCDSIGIAWSADGFSWAANASTHVAGYTGCGRHAGEANAISDVPRIGNTRNITGGRWQGHRPV